MSLQRNQAKKEITSRVEKLVKIWSMKINAVLRFWNVGNYSKALWKKNLPQSAWLIFLVSFQDRMEKLDWPGRRGERSTFT